MIQVLLILAFLVVLLAIVFWPVTLAIGGGIGLWWFLKKKRKKTTEKFSQYSNTSDLAKYYEILHLNAGATIEQVKEQYRRFALMYHPDKNGSRKKEAEQKFIAVTSAYEVIMNQSS